MDEEKKVYSRLDSLGIEFVKHIHPPVFTVEEANQHWDNISGLHCKNLFLRDKKGKSHYLVVLSSYKSVDIKKLNGLLNERLSFASPERLKKYLGLEPGSVSPFGLINDADGEVIVVLDSHILSVELINFHPNVNTATITIKREDFERFLASCDNKMTYCDF